MQKTSAFDLTRVLLAARPDGAPIVLVTGGLVADDRAAVAAAKKLGVPVHVIAVGPAPARGLLMQIATATGGTARFATPGDDLPTLARSVVADASTPATPLTVNWGTLAASEVVPGTLPRLGAGQAVLVLARVKKAQTANARAGGELFSIETLPAAKSVDGATSNIGPLGRRWARSRLEELLATNASASTVTTLAMQFGLVSPYTSMVAIGDEVVVQGGTRRSVSVPVSVPAGMKWQQVKKETTVETSSLGATKQEDKPAVDKNAKDGRGKRPPAEGPRPEPVRERPAPGETRGDDDAERDYSRNVPLKKQSRDREESEEEDSAGRDSPSIDVATTMSGATSAENVYITEGSAPPGMIARRLRLTTTFAGGFARTRGENAGLVAIGTRIEYGRSFLVGVEGSLLVVGGDDVRGRVMASFSKYGVTRYLEIGGALGVELGAGFGPAASLSLRYHLPPAPRGAVFLRYDASYLAEDDERRGQQQLTLGVEWGF
ncbi:MAG: hypothetical protein H0T65_00660 [Deltaproteobacteria bacterium]|nr:hypothetical protein [Deltaproteobacteria bacterium]